MNSLTSNISYGEVQSLPFDDLSNWVDKLRNELLSKWEEGVPPYLGSTPEKIADRFKLLRSYPVQDFYSTDNELYKDYIGFMK